MVAMRLACVSFIVCAGCTAAHTSRWFDFIPFGAGQFANDEPRKGAVFATAEGATAMLSLGTWLYLVEHYGPDCDACVSTVDSSHVRTLERVEVATGIAFLALYAAGVIDVCVHHRPPPRSSTRIGR